MRLNLTFTFVFQLKDEMLCNFNVLLKTLDWPLDIGVDHSHPHSRAGSACDTGFNKKEWRSKPSTCHTDIENIRCISSYFTPFRSISHTHFTLPVRCFRHLSAQLWTSWSGLGSTATGLVQQVVFGVFPCFQYIFMWSFMRYYYCCIT